jgi:hypothetical protein
MSFDISQYLFFSFSFSFFEHNHMDNPDYTSSTVDDNHVIDDRAYMECASLTCFSFNPFLTHIGHCAFAWCNSLVLDTPSLPITLTHIGNFAFAHCSSLTSIEFPSDLMYLGHEAFHSCIHLTSVSLIHLPSPLPVGFFHGENVFVGCTGLRKVVARNQAQIKEWKDTFSCQEDVEFFLQNLVDYVLK